MGNPDIFEAAGQEVEKRPPEKRFNLDRSIEDLVGSICDPIIAYPSPWMDTIPQSLKDQITMDRLIEQMVAHRENREPTGTDSEALAYLYPASLEAPIDHDWTEIYLYLGARVVKSQGGEVPDDINVRTLNRQQDEDLRRLKAWIYDRRRKHRTEKAKDIRKERLANEREEKQAKSPENLQSVFDLWKKD
ncbi:hypothetical protein ES705_17347 [subsurface metagenome]